MKTNISLLPFIIAMVCIYLLGVASGINYEKHQQVPCNEPLKIPSPTIVEKGIQKASREELHGYTEPLQTNLNQTTFREETHNGHLFGVWITRNSSGDLAISTQRLD